MRTAKWVKIKSEYGGGKEDFLLFPSYDRFDPSDSKVSLAIRSMSGNKDLYVVIDHPKKGIKTYELLIRETELVELLKWAYRRLDGKIRGELH